MALAPCGDAVLCAAEGSSDAAFRPCRSIGQRFPGLTGNILQSKVFEVYAVRRDCTLAYFKVVDGKRCQLLFRHSENRESLAVVKETYVQGVLKERSTEMITHLKSCVLLLSHM